MFRSFKRKPCSLGLDVDDQKETIISLSLSTLYLKDIVTPHGMEFQVHPQKKKRTRETFLS